MGMDQGGLTTRLELRGETGLVPEAYLKVPGHLEPGIMELHWETGELEGLWEFLG